MLFFIIGVILFVVSLFIIAFAESKSHGVVALVLAIILVVVSCVAAVPTGHTGVVTTFGRVEDRTLDAGISMKAPWQSVIRLDNRTQKSTVNLSCFSSDIQEVSAVFTINYQIKKSDAMTIYRTIGKNYYETVIMPCVSESVKAVAAQYTAEELIGSRVKLTSDIKDDLTTKLAAYNIELIDAAVEDMDFTDAFTDAVEAKQVAQQNKLKAETEAEQKVIEANAQAEIQRVEADAYAYEIATKAEAEAEANRKISASLTTALIDYTYAQQWNGEYPTVYGGEGTLPLVTVN